MANTRNREEIVGKRFLCAESVVKLKTSRVSEWPWKAGVVRAVSHRETKLNPDISVLLEFDGLSWEKREWYKISEVFQVFIVEDSLCWFHRADPYRADPYHADSTGTILWPCLTYRTVVDRVGYSYSRYRPVECVVDKDVIFYDHHHHDLKVVKVDDSSVYTPARSDPDVCAAIKAWYTNQDTQRVLLNDPNILIGYRVQVYRAQGTTQWYTAVIKSYTDKSKLFVVDDTVLEEHYEDPSLVQITLIGDGVIESILKGDEGGVAQRRGTRQAKSKAGGGGAGGTAAAGGGSGAAGGSANRLTRIGLYAHQTSSSSTSSGSGGSNSRNSSRCSSLQPGDSTPSPASTPTITAGPPTDGGAGTPTLPPPTLSPIDTPTPSPLTQAERHSRTPTPTTGAAYRHLQTSTANNSTARTPTPSPPALDKSTTNIAGISADINTNKCPADTTAADTTNTKCADNTSSSPAATSASKANVCAGEDVDTLSNSGTSSNNKSASISGSSSKRSTDKDNQQQQHQQKHQQHHQQKHQQHHPRAARVSSPSQLLPRSAASATSTSAAPSTRKAAAASAATSASPSTRQRRPAASPSCTQTPPASASSPAARDRKCNTRQSLDSRCRRSSSSASSPVAAATAAASPTRRHSRSTSGRRRSSITSRSRRKKTALNRSASDTRVVSSTTLRRNSRSPRRHIARDTPCHPGISDNQTCPVVVIEECRPIGDGGSNKKLLATNTQPASSSSAAKPSIPTSESLSTCDIVLKHTEKVVSDNNNSKKGNRNKVVGKLRCLRSSPVKKHTIALPVAKTRSSPRNNPSVHSKLRLRRTSSSAPVVSPKKPRRLSSASSGKATAEQPSKPAVRSRSPIKGKADKASDSNTDACDIISEKEVTEVTSVSSDESDPAPAEENSEQSADSQESKRNLRSDSVHRVDEKPDVIATAESREEQQPSKFSSESDNVATTEGDKQQQPRDHHASENVDKQDIKTEHKDAAICDKCDKIKVECVEEQSVVKEEQVDDSALIAKQNKSPDKISASPLPSKPSTSSAEHKAQSPERSEMALHYKKQHLHHKESLVAKKNDADFQPEKINMSVSLTDQYKKSKESWNNNDVNSGGIEREEGLSARAAAAVAHDSEQQRSRDTRLPFGGEGSRPSGAYGDKVHSDGKPVNIVAAMQHTKTTASSPSAASPRLHNSYKSSDMDKRTNPVDPMKQEDSRKVNSSPLVVDSKTPIEVYRDPELLKKDELQRAAAAVQKQKPYAGNERATPTASPGSNPPAAQALSGITNPAAAAGLMAPFLPLGASGLVPPPLNPATAAALQHLYPAQLLQQQHHQQLLQTQYAAAAALAAGAGPFPGAANPAWLLTRGYQEELMKAQEAAIERERRDRERGGAAPYAGQLSAEEQVKMIERDHVERERERAERKERERRMEMEKQEREKEMKRKELEAEMQKQRELDREREKIMREMKARRDREKLIRENAGINTLVDNHFNQSLSLSKCRPTGTWNPSTSGAPLNLSTAPRDKSPKGHHTPTPTHSPGGSSTSSQHHPQPPPHHPTPTAAHQQAPRPAHHHFSHPPHPHPTAHRGDPRDALPPREPPRHPHPGTPTPAQHLPPHSPQHPKVHPAQHAGHKLLTAEDKQRLAIFQETLIREQILGTSAAAAVAAASSRARSATPTQPSPPTSSAINRHHQQLSPAAHSRGHHMLHHSTSPPAAGSSVPGGSAASSRGSPPSRLPPPPSPHGNLPQAHGKAVDFNLYGYQPYTSYISKDKLLSQGEASDEQHKSSSHYHGHVGGAADPAGRGEGGRSSAAAPPHHQSSRHHGTPGPPPHHAAGQHLPPQGGRPAGVKSPPGSVIVSNNKPHPGAPHQPPHHPGQGHPQQQHGSITLGTSRPPASSHNDIHPHRSAASQQPPTHHRLPPQATSPHHSSMQQRVSGASPVVSYDLIRQGLVPNPLYSTTTTTNVTNATMSSSRSRHDTSSPSFASGLKRSPATDAVTSSQTVKKPKSDMYPANTTASLSNNGSRTPSFIDSFGSLVEKTVMNEFRQDEEREARLRNTYLHQQQQQNATSRSTTAATTTTTSNASASFVSGLTVSGGSGGPGSRCGTPGSTSDSIPFRAAVNGDLDSDCGAPSPQSSITSHRQSPSSKSTTSSMAKLGKKAWLQRYSTTQPGADDDNNSSCSTSSAFSVKKEASSTTATSAAATTSTYANSTAGSVASSSATVTVKAENTANTEDTNSLSETESQASTESTSVKRKMFERHLNNSKKQKMSPLRTPASDDESSTTEQEDEGKSGAGSGSSNSGSRAGSTTSNTGGARGAGNRKQRGRKKRESRTASKRASHTNDSSVETPSAVLANKPLNKVPHSRLKKTMEPFMQEGSCAEVAPKLMKCRECKMTPNQRNEKLPNIFCRFYAFRRLKYSNKGTLIISGFSSPDDAESDDVEIWKPTTTSLKSLPVDLDIAKYIITHVGDLFCDLVEQEREAMSLVPDATVAWKRAVQGVREMCDICETTLFNMHWVCHKCGFVVCIDCFKMRTRKGRSCRDDKCGTCESQGQRWLKCSVSKQAHEAEKLMLTQIIPNTALWDIGHLVHEARDKYNIRSNCPCGHGKKGIKDDDKKGLSNGVTDMYKDSKDSAETSSNPLSLLADVASYEKKSDVGSKKSDVLKEKFNGNEDSLDHLLRKKASGKLKNGILTKGGIDTPSFTEIINMVVENGLSSPSTPPSQCPPLVHYVPKNGVSTMVDNRPVKCNSLSETTMLFPGIPHSWLDNGRLLRLCEPKNPKNSLLFQLQWKQGQPVLVSNCDTRLKDDLWKPDTFCKEFGHLENDLINCSKGTVIVGQKMKVFWDGFEKVKMRLLDENAKPMTLKLKDWPPTEDFADILPKHFENLMEALPLPEYTHRTGVFNLASRLPEFFVKPDLGPKMYNAYGSSFQPKEASTNLHLDISDAVNLIMYVGIPKDDADRHRLAALKAIDDAGCDIFTKNRVTQGKEIPGALWHIYHPRDSDKIRDLLNKVAKERGEEIEAHHDPIHDQSWYLDRTLNDRLRKEYNVVGYTILQCLGDAVFIPAGAPHQVRNLHSCIKCAEDFVSPENLTSCFKMTQEFRHLSDTHSNHEDKLQVKNIIYHAVKDAVSILMSDKVEAD